MNFEKRIPSFQTTLPHWLVILFELPVDLIVLIWFENVLLVDIKIRR